jgi:hypothetical protein
MKRVFAALIVAAAFVAASDPSFARAGAGHGFGRYMRNPTVFLGAPRPPVASYSNRIPAPLAAPSQAPVINGPCSSGSCM